MRKVNAPLFEQLISHAASSPVSFHVPGHRYGNALRPGTKKTETERLAGDWFMPIMRLDATELSATDDLHHPEASIKEAERLAARLYGAERTHFLVGGSTAGNIAMLLAVCDAGDTVIVQRNVHKSIINGLKLAGAQAVFLMPQLDEKTGIATIPSVGQVEEALALYPNAKAVVLSNPNYYGMGTTLKHYAGLVHRSRIPLLVDEAHGAHYGFHPELPTSALQAGADVVVQSAHKTLHALTMGAWLHVQGDRIDRLRLQEALSSIQSSSPSFPIMASLDISRAIVEEKGAALFEPALESCTAFKNRLQERCTWLEAVSMEHRHAADLYTDPLRVMLTDKSGTKSGYQLQQMLEKYGCWAEMADPTHVLLLFGLSTGQDDVERLITACCEIEAAIVAELEKRDIILGAGAGAGAGAGRDGFAQPGMRNGMLAAISQPVSFGRRRALPVEAIPLSRAAGKAAAEMIIPYPPGIPLVYAGEKLTEAMVAHLAELAEQGAKFQGASDPSMATVRVFLD